MGPVFSRTNEDSLRRHRSKGLFGFRKKYQQVTSSSYETSLDGLANYILEGCCTNVVTLTGAGISESSWFSDLRLLIKRLDEPFNKFDRVPQLLDLSHFHSDPQMLYNVMKPMMMSDDGYPSLAHSFIRLLDEKGILLRHYTENMDNQEHAAGIAEQKVVQANGTFQYWSSTKCREGYQKDWVAESLLLDLQPKCIKCASLVRPDIVFFGEQLPRKFFENLRGDMEHCDFMLIMGTSLSVEPFACLPSMVNKNVPRLVMNDNELSASLGFKFGTRDVLWKGNPNQGCIELAKSLGWNIDLGNLRLKLDNNRLF